MNEIKLCEVCQSIKLEPALNLGLHPMCDDLVSISSNRTCKEYPIEIVFCNNCFTAHQKFQVPKHELFPELYHYRSRFTSDVLNGMKDLVTSCEQNYGSLSGKKVIDIGCNDGSLLDFFKAKGSETIGIEPTGASADAKLKGHQIFNNYFDVSIAKDIVTKYGNPDFITFTNVFAHIENLKEVTEALKVLIGMNSTLVIENHYLGAVLNKNQFDTFYHEHPRTYSAKSFEFIALSLGLNINSIAFPSRYGGNIRVFMSKSENFNFKKNRIDESAFYQKFKSMKKDLDKWVSVKSEFIENYVKLNGKIKAKAFPGRAAILIKLLGLDETKISAVYEKKGSMKIGNFLPGTRIPIYSDDDLFKLPDQNEPILNLAWHISDEIKSYLSQNAYTGTVIDIIDKTDFN